LGNSKSAKLTPWLTLVLGSEALEPPFYTPDTKRTGYELEERLSEHNIKEFGLLEGDIARFISSLMESRSIVVDKDMAVPDYAEWKLSLFLATAMLNKIYFETKAEFGMPVNRTSDDQLVFDSSKKRNRNYNTVVLRWRLLGEALEQLIENINKQAKKESEQETKNRLDSTRALIQQLLNGIHGGTSYISANDLLAVTEVAWYHLVDGFIDSTGEGVRPYLSWPELMVSIGIQPRKQGKGSYPTRHRPMLSDIETAVHTIRRKLEKSTRNWANRFRCQSSATDKERNEIDKAYKSYADTLYHQAMIRANTPTAQSFPSAEELLESTSRKGTDGESKKGMALSPLSPPVASAFVTTFDIELELALRHHHPNVAFVVAMPVNYVYKTDFQTLSRAKPLWLGYKVDPLGDCAEKLDGDEYRDRLLEDILMPGADKWFVLDSLGIGDVGRLEIDSSGASKSIALDQEQGKFEPLPFVVRLTGSPMVRLPSVAETDIEGVEKELREIEENIRRASARDLAALERRLQIKANELESLRKLQQAIVKAANLSKKTAAIRNAESSELKPQLQHALILEEYHSIQRSAPELMRIAQCSLPRGLSDVPDKNEYLRFWTLLGVQASDDAVLYHLIAQLVAAQIEEKEDWRTGDQTERMDDRDTGQEKSSAQEQSIERFRRLGLAINSKGSVTERALDLLLWSELDVISDSVVSFSDELQHYDRHLVEQLKALPGKVEIAEHRTVVCHI
jgi:hypothetical protein